jgi:predicted RNA-binding Zn-ribbon protein involved in translation (DUF1610 family)
MDFGAGEGVEIMAIIEAGPVCCHPAGVEIETTMKCISCEKYWVIEGVPNNTLWYCPWCGLKQDVSADNK